MRLAARMQLHFEEWGTGERVALLLHGFMGSAEGWWRVGPALAARGYRVLALDLPGHGRSPADPELTIARAVRHIAETVAEHSDHVDVAIGHSFGGLLLSAGLDELAPSAVVYVDAPFTVVGGDDPAVTRPQYERAVTSRTVSRLREDRPSWSETDREVEERAARRFDVDTAVALDASPGGTWLPRVPPRSLIIRADPSRFVSDADLAAFRSAGLDAASIPGSAHAIWYSHFDEFWTVLCEFLEDATGPSPIVE